MKKLSKYNYNDNGQNDLKLVVMIIMNHDKDASSDIDNIVLITLKYHNDDKNINHLGAKD